MHGFDYLLANPPFGVDWKAEKKEIDRWPNFRGDAGKLPRISDGALLFLLHMISKFADYQPGSKDLPGSRAAVVFNGSRLFTGGAGSGESDIRRWIIEQDMLEARRPKLWWSTFSTSPAIRSAAMPRLWS